MKRNATFTFFCCLSLFTQAQQWQTLPQPPGSDPLQGYYVAGFIDANNGIVRNGSQKLYTTSDGGNSWVPRTTPLDGIPSSFGEISRVGSDVWMIVENGIILKSNNGGANWNVMDVPEPMNVTLRDIHFANATTGWAGGNVLYKSTDGGATWTNAPTLPSGEILSLQALGNDTIIASTQFGITYSTDGANTWSSPQDLAFTSWNLKAYSFENVFAVGSEARRFTKLTPPANWFNYTPNPSGIVNSQYYGVDTYDGVHFLMSGNNHGTYLSNDAGLNWTPLTFATATSFEVFYSIVYAGDETAFLGGSEGVYKLDLSTGGGNVSVNEANTIDFNLYPNPSSETLYIELNSNENQAFNITDLAGKTIQSGFLNQSIHSVDIQALNPGVYLMNIGSKSMKFIKTNN